MNEIASAKDVKIIQQIPRAVEGRGPHTRTARTNILGTQFWKQPLQRVQEGGFAQRAIVFCYSLPPIFSSHAPKAGKSQRGERIAQTEIKFPITFPLQCDPGIGATSAPPMH